MENEINLTVVRLMFAALAGGLIGLERSYHGRPAGFRTHTLVCIASSLLMLLAIFQWELLKDAPIDTIRVDPTRMAQGIMTGIGFLGAGVIIKESLTVRGLTTAASIWLTAAIGVVIGMGLYFAALASTVLALGVLVLFRHIEAAIPSMQYAQLKVHFSRHEMMTEQALREVIAAHNVRCTRLSYFLEHEGKTFLYEMTVHSNAVLNFKKLAETLTELESVEEFSLVPIGD
jgi:putative Mg2+ transporter-C (MgtC) family protein